MREPLTPRWLVCSDGRISPLPVSRWHGEAEDALRVVVARGTGPTLDVGCGPGRLTAALTRAGRTALGVDICAHAVRLTRARGAAAVHGCVFSALPREGWWTHVLLVDGNIGIGGDPAALLRRCGGLVRADGTVTVEVEPGGVGLWQGHAWVRSAPVPGPTPAAARFRWARVGVDAVATLSRDAGLVVREVFRQDGRWFAEFGRRPSRVAHRSAAQRLGAGPVESRTTSR
ncbi:SAM-dependent methyltransferase [Micromonospora craterilacus]|uniref:SAM-dependent methyltransferase n=1 Tax=Micromonospora craterilacus TaxID=1655439 RepID=A0A2W2FQ15_9ACTN|nr:class I SAM-dependent methyltransferase [Micromonospora craterilacus]PZG17164.1 SAM-dependent methyltransferase [Micromonospora craterilacus]